MRRESERMSERGVSDFSAEVNRQQQADYSDNTRFRNFSFAKAIHVKAHEQRQRDRESYRESSPGRFSQSVYYDQSETRKGDDHDEENRDGRDYAGEGADFAAGDLGERFSFAPNAGAENHEVMHRPAETDTYHQPQQSRQKTELRCEHRPRIIQRQDFRADEGRVITIRDGQDA